MNLWRVFRACSCLVGYVFDRLRRSCLSAELQDLEDIGALHFVSGTCMVGDVCNSSLELEVQVR